MILKGAEFIPNFSGISRFRDNFYGSMPYIKELKVFGVQKLFGSTKMFFNTKILGVKNFWLKNSANLGLPGN